MAKLALYNMDGSKDRFRFEVSDAVFAAEVNTNVMHQVVVNYLASQRQGTQSTKTRTEVQRRRRQSPGDRKAQAAQDRVRIRAPQWTGGGVALGPKPRSYRLQA